MHSLDPALLTIVSLAFLTAGTIKGVIGLAFPTVAIAILALTIGLKEGIALIIIPTILTNVWQALVGKEFWQLVRRFWPFIVMGGLGTWFATGILARSDATHLTAILGIIIIIYSSLGLARREFRTPDRHEIWLSPVMGLSSGVLMGITGAFFFPGLPYLQSLRLPRDSLIQLMGIAFASVTVVLGAALTRYELLSLEMGITSTVALLPAFLGMAGGQWIRRRLSEERFRLFFYSSLLITGLYMTARLFWWE